MNLTSPPLILEQEYIESLRENLPELPYERAKRYIEEFGIAKETAALLVTEKALADYFQEGLALCSKPRSLANWMIVEFGGRLKERGNPLWKSGIPAKHIAQLVHMIETGVITGKMAKELADLMVKEPNRDPEQMVRENPSFQPLVNEQALDAVIEKVLTEQSASVADFLAGKTRAYGFLVGQIMAATQGKAPPPLVNKLLQEKLEKRKK